jgi:hypothetical protein
VVSSPHPCDQYGLVRAIDGQTVGEAAPGEPVQMCQGNEPSGGFIKRPFLRHMDGAAREVSLTCRHGAVTLVYATEGRGIRAKAAFAARRENP